MFNYYLLLFEIHCLRSQQSKSIDMWFENAKHTHTYLNCLFFLSQKVVFITQLCIFFFEFFNWILNNLLLHGFTCSFSLSLQHLWFTRIKKDLYISNFWTIFIVRESRFVKSTSLGYCVILERFFMYHLCTSMSFIDTKYFNL